MSRYQSLQKLTQCFGNNAFSWEKRKKNYKTDPYLFVPNIIQGYLHDAKIGNHIVFEEEENGILRSCVGLEHFIEQAATNTTPKILLVDNHNHVLYFWIEALRMNIIQQGCELIHIDEHSDLWENSSFLDLQKAMENPDYAWEFTNILCNVGNYIQPAIQAKLIETMIRIENEYQIDAFLEYTPQKNSILNIDLDIFSDELSYIDNQKKIDIIKNMLPKVSYVTIATSPFFIQQETALFWLHKIFI